MLLGFLVCELERDNELAEHPVLVAFGHGVSHHPQLSRFRAAVQRLSVRAGPMHPGCMLDRAGTLQSSSMPSSWAPRLLGQGASGSLVDKIDRGLNAKGAIGLAVLLAPLTSNCSGA